MLAGQSDQARYKASSNLRAKTKLVKRSEEHWVSGAVPVTVAQIIALLIGLLIVALQVGKESSRI